MYSEWIGTEDGVRIYHESSSDTRKTVVHRDHTGKVLYQRIEIVPCYICGSTDMRHNVGMCASDP